MQLVDDDNGVILFIIFNYNKHFFIHENVFFIIQCDV